MRSLTSLRGALVLSLRFVESSVCAELEFDLEFGFCLV